MSSPVRMCVACRTRADKSGLDRIVWRDGKLVSDEKQVFEGRGAYVCRDEACLKKAINKKLIGRAIKRTLVPEDYEAFWEKKRVVKN